MTASAPTPGQARGASVWKQNRNLIAMLAATIVTVVAIATAVVAATTSGKTEKVAPDSALVELIEAIDRTDRAFWTELQDRGVSNAQATTCETYQPAEASANLDAAAEQLHDAAAAVGIDRLALTESTADQQIKLLLEEPATRVEQARQRLCTGTPGGLTLAATFDRSRQALADLAHKIPPLLANSVLVPQAQAYADAMNPDQPTVLATATPPPDDPRAIALAGLRETVGTFVDDAADGPPILRVIAIVLGAAAVLLWALVILLRTVFATTPAPSAERATAQGPRRGDDVKKAPDAVPTAPAPPTVETPARPAPARPAPTPAGPAAAPVSRPSGTPAPPTATAPTGRPGSPRPEGAPTTSRPGAPTGPAAAPPGGAKRPRVPFAPVSPRSAPGANAPATPEAPPAAKPAAVSRPPAANAPQSGTQPQANAPQLDPPQTPAAGAADKPATQAPKAPAPGAPKRPGPRVPWRTTDNK